MGIFKQWNKTFIETAKLPFWSFLIDLDLPAKKDTLGKLMDQKKGRLLSLTICVYFFIHPNYLSSLSFLSYIKLDKLNQKTLDSKFW